MENSLLSKVFKYLRKNKRPPEGWNNTKMVINILGILLGLKYIHKHNIVHLDINPSTILLDSNFYPKISNFLACHIIDENSTDDLTKFCDAVYSAPEILIGNDHMHLQNSHICDYAFKIDVYSIGMILYEFYSNYLPITRAKTALKKVKNVLKGFRPDDSKVKNKEVKELIMRCWSEDSFERPSIDEIIQHYTKDREIYLPQNVDEEEVENYLKKYDHSLYKTKLYIVQKLS